MGCSSVDLPVSGERLLGATVKLYHKDTWDSLTGKKEAVKKLENQIKEYAKDVFTKKFNEMKQRAEKFTLEGK